jgi:hypothetical protein
LVARRSGRIVGALPTFERCDPDLGTVYNSLPFFGSAAGVVTDETLDGAQRRAIAASLFDALRATADENEAAAATLITSQFDPDNSTDGNDLYERYIDARYREDRVAQVLPLDAERGASLNRIEGAPSATPESAEDARTVGELLFTAFERRCRRAVRKPYKEGLSWRRDDNFGTLYKMHREGMDAKGGTPKPARFFDAVLDLVPEDRYDLLYASLDGRDVAGLLVFYHNNTVEYHTPAYETEYREYQATSMLIFEAMRDAVSNGYRYWNFGGTRDSQKSLYRFKRGWGATDYRYHYYVCDYGGVDDLLELEAPDLLNRYPWFYTVPFKHLK